MRGWIACVAAVVLGGALALAQTRGATTLDVYVVDVEGGNATLFVAPSGESLLIDTGNGGAGAVRDAERILSAARDAGITQIDHLITTHYHGDHIGGLAELAARIPIRHFIDHSPSWGGYQGAAARRRQAESVLRVVQAPRGQSGLGAAGWQHRRRAVCREPHHVWEVSSSVSGRPDLEQGIRSHVSDESDRDRGPVRAVTSWASELEFRGAGACHPAPGRDHEQRYPQRRTA